MATYTRPDVYIEEILTPDNAPQGVSTSIAAFVGATQRGPANKAILVSSFDDFKRVFGDALEKESLFYSVRSFFQNGGSFSRFSNSLKSLHRALGQLCFGCCCCLQERA